MEAEGLKDMELSSFDGDYLILADLVRATMEQRSISGIRHKT